MSDVFISYARATEMAAAAMATLLRARGVGVWRDDEIPPHRPFGDVIEERLRASKAVLVLWSAEAATSHWVRAEAEYARGAGKLVQLTLDGAPLPLPFNQVQCAPMTGWAGDPDHPALARILASIDELTGRALAPLAPAPVTRRAGIHLTVAPAGDVLAEQLGAALALAVGRQPALSLAAGDAQALHRLEVGLRTARSRARLTARLLELPAGRQLWAEQYDGDANDPFAFEDMVTPAIAAGVEAAVRRARLAAAESLAAPNPEALVMAAAAALNRMTATDLRHSRHLLERPLAEAPTADAHALAALAAASLHVNGHPGHGEDDRQAAIHHARQALAMAGNAAFATGLPAVVLAYMGQALEPSLALTDRLVARMPGFAAGYLWRGQVRLVAGDLPGAIAALGEAGRLDPAMSVRPIQLGTLGAALLLAGDVAAAVPPLMEAVALCPGIPMNNLFLASTLGHAGRIAEGQALLADARRIADPADFRLPLTPADAARFRSGLARLEG